ncbi:MAG: aldo/keto reductase [Planctomycetaceae bacterium]
MSNTISLRTGDHLPAVGLGLWKVPENDCPALVKAAVETGYRHFDCACDYGNEAAVGAGLQQVLDGELCRREDLWITSKLWNTFHRPEHVALACRKSLVDLQVDHLDLYLMHFPIAQRHVPIDVRYPPGWFFDPAADSPQMELDRVPLAETWGAMEQLREQGLVRNIGVCNFGTAILRDLLNSAATPPAVLQVESHPYLTQDKLLRFCQQEEIAYTAFSPFGAASYYELGMADRSDSLLEHATIQDVSASHGRTPAQVLLRWGVQRGTAVVPKTSRAERLRENLAVFDFTLTDEQMNAISTLNQNRRYNDPGVFCEAAFNTFCPIYE